MNLEAKAREWLSANMRNMLGGDPLEHDVQALAALLRSVAAEARKEALEEAMSTCARVARIHQGAFMALECVEAIRALAGRKEGT